MESTDGPAQGVTYGPPSIRKGLESANSHVAVGGLSELAIWVPNLLASSATTFS